MCLAAEAPAFRFDAEAPEFDADPNDLRIFLQLEALLIVELLQANRGPREHLLQALSQLVPEGAQLSGPQIQQISHQAEVLIQAYGREVLPEIRKPLLQAMNDIGQRTRQTFTPPPVPHILTDPRWSGGETVAGAARQIRPVPANPPASAAITPNRPAAHPLAAAPNGTIRITSSWTAADARAMEYLANTQAMYAGRFIEQSMVNRARLIVTRNYSLFGDQPEKVAQRVHQGLVNLAGVTDSYFQTMAVNALANGRTYANLTAMLEAGVTHYRFVAVLDERTTTICRSLNGKTWPVRPSLDRFERAMQARDLDALQVLRPMVRDEGDGFAFGPKENPTTFGTDADLGWLAAQGVCIPPLHFYCRSTIKPA